MHSGMEQGEARSEVILLWETCEKKAKDSDKQPSAVKKTQKGMCKRCPA